MTTPSNTTTAPVVSRWLEPAAVCLLAQVSTYLLPFAVGLHWSLVTTGAALQVLGATWAALGVPVTSDGLARAERAIGRRRTRARIWFDARREALREWWERRRGHVRVTASPGGAHAYGISPAVEVDTAMPIRPAPSTEQRIAELERNAEEHRLRLDALERGQVEQDARWAEHLAAQERALRMHTQTVTRTGWEFILGGLTCSGFGALLSLLA